MERPAGRSAFDDHAVGPAAAAEGSPAAELVAPATTGAPGRGSCTPVAIFKSPSGETIFDLGQNITGWVRLSGARSGGTTVTLRLAEVLDQARQPLHRESRAAEPDRPLHAARAAGKRSTSRTSPSTASATSASRAARRPPTLDMITGIVVHSDLAPHREFETSDSMLNQLQHNIVWGQRGNFLDVPTDCPQRDERLGWTGDAQVFARTAAFNMNVSGFFAKWLGDLAADQDPGGSVPWVIPESTGRRLGAICGGGWLGRCVDRGSLDDVPGLRRSRACWNGSTPACGQWVEYARRQAGPRSDLAPGWHFGDWLAWHSDDPSYPGATTGKISSPRPIWLIRPTCWRAPRRRSAGTADAARVPCVLPRRPGPIQPGICVTQRAGGGKHADRVRARTRVRAAAGFPGGVRGIAARRGCRARTGPTSRPGSWARRTCSMS